MCVIHDDKKTVQACVISERNRMAFVFPMFEKQVHIRSLKMVIMSRFIKCSLQKCTRLVLIRQMESVLHQGSRKMLAYLV